MNLVQEIKFAIECGKEVKVVKSSESEVHFICEKIGYWVVSAEEAEQVFAFLPQEKKIDLTKKEIAVLKAIYENTSEPGLPVEVSEIQEMTGFSKKSIVGVLSSLYKKDLVESYGNDIDDEFCLSDEGFEIFEEVTA